MASRPITQPTYFASTGVTAELRGDHVFLSFAGGEIMLTVHNARMLSLSCEAAFLQHHLASLKTAPSNVIRFPKAKAKRRA